MLHSWIFLDVWVAGMALYMAHGPLPLDSSSFILKITLLISHVAKELEG